MRIQHNITAMNSYRTYSGNTSKIGKNLEKLSSGYRINRAGDDAAGLAISEKMRVQITGLEQAQANAKSGISLVQTAEGALTEVHDMLNRMYTLAEQSANGTYANELDREQLQKEVDSLRTEIDRIADSTNYNGINLLDGSLSGKSQVRNIAMNSSAASQGSYTTSVAFKASPSLVSNTNTSTLTTNDIGKTLDYTVSWIDGNGKERQNTVSLTFQGTGGDKPTVDLASPANNYFTDAQGNKISLAASDGALTADQLGNGFLASLKMDADLSENFTMSYASGKITFKAKEAGSAGAVIKDTGVSNTFDTVVGTNRKLDIGGDGTAAVDTVAMDSVQKFDIATIQGRVATSSHTTADKISERTFEIDGHKFIIADNTFKPSQVQAVPSDVHIITLQSPAASLDATSADMKLIASQIQQITGLETKVATSSDVTNSGPGGGTTSITKGDILLVKDTLRMGGKALDLQIGDTADKFNQLSVSVKDMHVAAMGVSGIDISTQEGAAAAMKAIKSAVNYVSDNRGTLGALQNRLDHTINNLGVMQENIQDAESVIRDTDVAKEMMTYTKNNILVQSAQAMLAQANQLPQGVLQLLS